MSDDDKMVRMRATQRGFINNSLQEEGQEFECLESQVSSAWMEPVEPEPEKKGRGAKASAE